ncbi:barstar family protein [Rhodopirellula sp. SWK7]|uniref:barstar family protein n=1 Tax=Rhodopirellula sp. SWK7 TaxID=595460 RepID=UPI0002BDD1E9|nr:barstar family protein [Rhodopirellula sp. SWK7]EMI40264.1 LigA protein [Rhodopirellula sp. SWK7]
MGNESHDQRYSQLQAVREAWCRSARDVHDRSGGTIELDGREMVDIPSFYLALGRAVNGQDGYYGGCLDALSDCLSGGFGLVPPFTLRIRHADAARDALGHAAMVRWRESWIASVESDATLTDADRAAMGAPFPDLQPDVTPYFDSIVSVLTDGGVNVVLDSAGT